MCRTHVPPHDRFAFSSVELSVGPTQRHAYMPLGHRLYATWPFLFARTAKVNDAVVAAVGCLVGRGGDFLWVASLA